MSISQAKRRQRAVAQHHSIRFLIVGGIVLAFFAAVFFCGMGISSSWLSDLPRYDNIAEYTKSGITTIYANDKETLLAKIYLENRIETDIDHVSPYVLEGTIATEDERFYKHRGVDLEGIVRAFVNNLQGGSVSEGASTITQQLVRNTVLLDEMNDISIKRKIREMYIACQVEKVYTKDQILMMYLNVVNFGDSCYGIEAASKDYFDCSADELTLSQAALLVGIPQSPNANNPRYNYDNAISRRNTVLERMLRNGYITQDEYDEALADEPKISDKNLDDDTVSDIAPYFVDYVKTLLESDEEYPTSEISKGGLTVYTTLDKNCQTAANTAVKEGLKYQGAMDGSLTSIDPDNGHIVAMVGGTNYKQNKFNLATQMTRQAGSSFKTFTLLAALDAGVDPENTYIDSDSPADINGWEVTNSEGEGGGSMNLSDATTYSVNTVFARTIATIGASRVVKMANKCGITEELAAYNSITLGTSGVNTLEMADAYATIANGGYHHDPVAITQILDRNGNNIYTHVDDAGEQVLSAALANTATNILKRVVTEGTGTGAQLYTGQEAAGKTGTSEYGRDLWFCGFTPQYSTAIWCGYRKEQETYSYGGTICAPIWHDYMTAVLADSEIEEFPTTDETLEYTYDWDFSQYDDYY